MMTFEKWLKKQKNRDDPIGDLARDFIDSRCKNIKQSFEKYKPCLDAERSYQNALKEYIKFNEMK